MKRRVPPAAMDAKSSSSNPKHDSSRSTLVDDPNADNTKRSATPVLAECESESDRSSYHPLGSFVGTEPADEELVRDYLATRDEKGFERIVRRYERELYTFLRRFLGDAQAAEDVFQATFLSVHLRIEQFEEGRRFRPWVYAIASNKAIDYMRRNKRHQIGSLNATNPASNNDDPLIQQLAGTEIQPDQLAISNETSGRVRQALQQLNEPTQQLIQLAFYQGMKYSDIAEVLQIPLGTVKSRVFTAVRKLNAIWMRMNESNVTDTNE